MSLSNSKSNILTHNYEWFKIYTLNDEDCINGLKTNIKLSSVQRATHK